MPRRLHAPLAAFVIVAATAFVYRPLLDGKVLAGIDLFREQFLNASLLQESLTARRLDFWNPYVRLGQPFAGSPQAQIFYPPRVLAVLLFGPYRGVTAEQLLHVFIACLGVYLAARKLGASRVPSSLAGGAFSLSVLMTGFCGLQHMYTALSWSGFVLAAAIHAARHPGRHAAARLALPLGASLLCGAPEASMWQSILAACAVLAFAPKEQRRAALATIVGGVAWAACLAAVMLLPAAEFARRSDRAADLTERFLWAATLPDLLSVAWPASGTSDTGPWQLVPSFFVGALIALFAPVALLGGGGKGRRSRVLLAFALGAALLSLGAAFPPGKLLLTLPPLRFFRYPLKYLLAAVFCCCLLAAGGIDRATALAAVAKPGRRRWPSLLGIWLGLAVGGLVILRFLPERSGGLLWVLIFAGAALGILGVSAGHGRRRARQGRNVLAALAAGELLLAHALAAPPVAASVESLTRPSSVSQLMAQSGWSRLTAPKEDPLWPKGGDPAQQLGSLVEHSRELLIANRFAEDRLFSIGGYGAPVALRPEVALNEGVRGVFDFAGVSLFVSEAKLFPDLQQVGALRWLGEEPVLNVYRNDRALPRAFVVHRARAVGWKDAWAGLSAPDEPFRHTAFLELAAGELLPPTVECQGSRATVSASERDLLRIDVEACGDGVLVVSDSFYPGWEATVDGHPAQVHCANFLSRAVGVPGGTHQVELRYAPRSVRLGGAISLVALLGLGMSLAGRRRRDDSWRA